MKTPPGGSRQSSGLDIPIRKKVNIAQLHGEVKAALGISLMAEAPGDTVHGHVSGISHPLGLPLPCPMCEGTAPHTDCYEVVLYESPEAPGKNHATTVAPHGLDTAKKAQLAGIVNAHVAVEVLH